MFLVTTIATWLISKRPSLTRVYAERLVKIALTALLALIAVVAFLWWLDAREDAAVEADRAQSRAEAISKAREADQRAGEAAQATQDRIEQSNKRARDAAEGSEDPLADMFEALRRK